MDKVRLTQVFNRGFRRAANERAAAGLTPSADLRTPAVPSAPEDCGSRMEQLAWAEGYEMGYQVGASDAELAGVEVPGAHGMVSGFEEGFLEMTGFFKRLSDHDTKA
jgi:hypothetical protein